VYGVDTKARTAEAEVLATLALQRKGFHDKDAAAIAELYTDDARLATLAPPLLDGQDEAGLALWLSAWDGPVKLENRDTRISIDGSLAVCHGLTHVSVRNHEGEDIGWWMRTTICLRRENGGWKIFHEHESVPFYMDGSLKAAVDLTS
jgi:ketosteroid isomerase-like protein